MTTTLYRLAPSLAVFIVLAVVNASGAAQTGAVRVG